MSMERSLPLEPCKAHAKERCSKAQSLSSVSVRPQAHTCNTGLCKVRQNVRVADPFTLASLVCRSSGSSSDLGGGEAKVSHKSLQTQALVAHIHKNIISAVERAEGQGGIDQMPLYCDCELLQHLDNTRGRSDHMAQMWGLKTPPAATAVDKRQAQPLHYIGQSIGLCGWQHDWNCQLPALCIQRLRGWQCMPIHAPYNMWRQDQRRLPQPGLTS